MNTTNTTENTIRILLADDFPLLRQGVATVINQVNGMTVVAEASNGEEAAALYREHKPDVALIDLRMPGTDGVHAIRGILAADPSAKVIILSMSDREEDIDAGIKAGAKGYVLKDICAEGLVQCIRDVYDGKFWMAPLAAARLAERMGHPQPSPRELDVLQLVAHGKANKEIAKELNITDGTVRVHLTNIFQKLGVTSRTEAVAAAIKRGLVRL